MGRPPCCRKVLRQPACRGFSPDAPHDQRVVVLGLDELEAVRLADLDGLYHADAARRMEVSRATFGRVLEAGRRRIAEAIVNGLALRIEGGPACTRQGDCHCPKRQGPDRCPVLAALQKEEKDS